MSALGIVLWIWLLVALVIYLIRLVRWIGRRGDEPPPPTESPLLTPIPKAPLIVDGQVVEPGVAAALAEEEKQAALDAAPLPVVEAPEGAPRPPVAEALQGITMPCGLTPLLGDVTALDPHHVTFSTTGAPSTTVSGELTAELERLGFEVTAVNAYTSRAVSDRATVTVVVHSDPKEFPTVPTDAVVVELST